MRKLLLAVSVFALGIFAPAILQANEISVTIDGANVYFDGQGPIIVDGRVLVPVRDVFETLGFDVEWEQDIQTVFMTREDQVVIIIIGLPAFHANGELFWLDVPAQIIGDRTLLPIRLILESVGYHVDWDASTSTVLVSSSPISREVAATAQPRFDSTIGVSTNTIASSFVILDDGSLLWARRDGLEQIMDNVVHISIGTVHAAAITGDGELWAWGSNQHGQIGNGTTERQDYPVHIMDNVLYVSAGNIHTMAITADNQLWGWGHNGGGRLGIGFRPDSHSPVHVMDNVAAVSAGSGDTIAITTDGSLWGWGGALNPGFLYPMRLMDGIVIMLPTQIGGDTQ
jgi:hypothetical protein